MDDLVTKNIVATLEIKEIGDEYVHIEGLASTFGGIDRVGDTIVRGAFANALAKRMPKLIYQHDMRQIIGVIDQATEREDGLFIKGRMPRKNSTVMDLLPLLEMRALGDFSIGFNIMDFEMTPEGSRILKEIDLWEVSIVTIPANPDAKITYVKKLDTDVDMIDAEKAESITTKREFEAMLMDTGCFTRKACVTLAARFNQSDSETGQRDSVIEEKLLKEAVDKLKKSLTK